MGGAENEWLYGGRGEAGSGRCVYQRVYRDVRIECWSFSSTTSCVMCYDVDVSSGAQSGKPELSTCRSTRLGKAGADRLWLATRPRIWRRWIEGLNVVEETTRVYTDEMKGKGTKMVWMAVMMKHQSPSSSSIGPLRRRVRGGLRRWLSHKAQAIAVTCGFI